MPTSRDHIKHTYPLPAFSYRVTVLPIPTPITSVGAHLGADLGLGETISCSQVTGLSMEIETVTYKHGMSFITGQNLIPAQRKEVNFSLKKGVFAHSHYLSDWMNLVYPVIVPRPANLIRKRDIIVDLIDESGDPSVRWIVIKAMPTKLTAPDFDASTNEVAFEQMDLIAQHLTVNYLDRGNIF